MKLKEFREKFEIDRRASGIRAIPKGVEESKIKKHKYRAEATTVDGIKFPSKKEAKIYGLLTTLERGGAIADLLVNANLHGPNRIRYHLIWEPIQVWYEPDFQYVDLETGEYVVADAKGVRTQEYKRKKKLMKKLFNIDIKEF